MTRPSIPSSDLGWVAILVVLIGVGCGKVGDPLPPFISVPESASDFTVEQVGYELRFAWTNPLRNVDQSASTDLERALIQIGDDVIVETIVPGPGQRQTFTLPARDLVGSSRQYTIRFETTSGRVSGPSNLVSLAVVDVPGPGSRVRVTVDQDRILLEWDPPVNGLEFTDGYRLYRSGEMFPNLPITETRFEDTDYREGEDYVYTIVPVRQTSSGWVEGLASEPVEVTAIDRTPPRAPTGLSLIPFQGGVFVRWNPSPESDVVRYWVFRREGPGDPFRAIGTEPQATTAYQDPDYQPGYEYAVTALDRSGNEGPMSSLPNDL